jgi:hypothetical protein
MKVAFVVLLFTAPLFAQDQAAITSAQSACGPLQVTFAASADGAQHPSPQPDLAKALVFVVADLGQCVECDSPPPFGTTDVSGAVIRIGVDGAWIGASRGNSYLFFSTMPGEHHLCANWQSSLPERARAFSMAGFTAEAGKVYYFRARLFPGHGDYSFDLDLINSDEGKFLVASSTFCVSHAKK